MPSPKQPAADNSGNTDNGMAEFVAARNRAEYEVHNKARQELEVQLQNEADRVVAVAQYEAEETLYSSQVGAIRDDFADGIATALEKFHRDIAAAGRRLADAKKNALDARRLVHPEIRTVSLTNNDTPHLNTVDVIDRVLTDAQQMLKRRILNGSI